VTSARAGLAGRVDGILEELQVAAEVDADGDWRLQTDVGPFLLVIDRDSGDLVAIQTIRRMEPTVADHADVMYLLMRLNLEAEGACFAALKDGETDLLILAARLKADAVTRESVEAMLRDATGLSRRLDEVTGTAPPG
jgi:Tir chaperone family protein CesT